MLLDIKKSGEKDHERSLVNADPDFTFSGVGKTSPSHTQHSFNDKKDQGTLGYNENKEPFV